MKITTATLSIVYATGKRVKCASYVFNAGIEAVQRRHDMIVQGLVNRAYANGFDALQYGDFEVTVTEYNAATYTNKVEVK